VAAKDRQKPKRPVAVDLFSGAGGLAEGLAWAGINVAVAVEKHPHPALTCAFNHPKTKVVCGDITNLTAKKIAGFVKEKTNSRKVDLVAGGPPCQGFSPAGARNKNDPRNQLFKQFLEIVKGLKPRVFLFENVPGFAKLYDGYAFRGVVEGFRELGYTMHNVPDKFPRKGKISTEDFPLLDALDYGVPQRRKRFILVGWKEGEVEHGFQWPKETHGPNSKDKTPYVTVEEALSDLAFLTGGFESHVYSKEPASHYQEQRQLHAEILCNHLATKHASKTVEMFKAMKPGCTIRTVPPEIRTGKQTMCRMDPDSYSKSVLALPDDFVHYSQHRIPTVREMARLQSFDDDFVFLGKRTTSDKSRRVDVPQYTQVGNAVPPLLAKKIGEAIVKMLGCRSKDLRDHPQRKKRKNWLQGSSGFFGYSLVSGSQFDLVDKAGKKCALPILKDPEESLVVDLTKATDWSRRGRRTFAYLGKKGAKVTA
jgi:DNA (cytosine-5)-methyltransferase 1